MDIATFTGIAWGIGLVFTAIFLGGHLRQFINVPGFMILAGGVVATVLITYPFSKMKGILRIIKKAIFQKQLSPDEVVTDLLRCSANTRKQGILALKEDLENIDDSFLKKGIKFITEGKETATILSYLGAELNSLIRKYKIAQRLMNTCGEMSIAFGIMGTLVCLIKVLQAASNLSNIIHGIGYSFLAVLYGYLAKNFIFRPLECKLKDRLDEEILNKELTIQGILAIHAGANPSVTEKKLKATLISSVTNIAENRQRDFAYNWEGN